MSKKDKTNETKELLTPAEGEVICVVTDIIGANYVRAACMDGVTRVCRIPGKLRKKVWINIKDVVLVAVWEFQKDRGDIVHRYERSERKKLIELGLLSKELLEGGSE